MFRRFSKAKKKVSMVTREDKLSTFGHVPATGLVSRNVIGAIEMQIIFVRTDKKDAF